MTKYLKKMNEETKKKVRKSQRLRYYHTCVVCKKILPKHIKVYTFPVDDKNVENNWPEVFINQKSEKGIFIKLCSQHFERNCFKDDDRTLLKPRSVPTIFYPSTIYPHKQLPMKPLKRLRGRPKRAVIQSEPNVENSSEFELELTTETLKNRETIIKSSIKPAMANIEFVRHELAARGVEIDIMPSSTTTNVLEIQKEPDVKMLSELEIGSTIKTLQSRGITVEKCVKHAMANLEFIRHELAARGVEIDIMPSSTTTKVLEIQKEPNVEMPSEFDLELTTETLQNRETIVESQLEPAMTNIEFVCHELAARGVKIDMMPSSTTTKVLEIQKEPDVEMPSEFDLELTTETLQNRETIVESQLEPAMTNIEFVCHELAARGVKIDMMPSSTTTKVLEIQKEPDVEMPSEFDLELTTETLQNRETIVESQLEPAMTNIEFVCHELAARGVKIDMMPSSTTTKVLEIQKEPDVEMPSEFDLELTTETLQNRETIVESQLEPAMTNIEFVCHELAARGVKIDIMPSSTTTKVLEIQKEPDVEMPSEFDLELTTETLQNQETIVESQLEPAMTNIEFVCHELAARGVKIDMMPSSTTTKVLEIQKEPDVEMPSEFDLELTTETLQNRETIVESQLEPAMTNIEFVCHELAARRVKIDMMPSSTTTKVLEIQKEPDVEMPSEFDLELTTETLQNRETIVESQLEPVMTNIEFVRHKSATRRIEIEQQDDKKIKISSAPVQLRKRNSMATSVISDDRPIIVCPAELVSNLKITTGQKEVPHLEKSAALNQGKIKKKSFEEQRDNTQIKVLLKPAQIPKITSIETNGTSHGRPLIEFPLELMFPFNKSQKILKRAKSAELNQKKVIRCYKLKKRFEHRFNQKQKRCRHTSQDG